MTASWPTSSPCRRKSPRRSPASFRMSWASGRCRSRLPPMTSRPTNVSCAAAPASTGASSWMTPLPTCASRSNATRSSPRPGPTSARPARWSEAVDIPPGLIVRNYLRVRRKPPERRSRLTPNLPRRWPSRGRSSWTREVPGNGSKVSLCSSRRQTFQRPIRRHACGLALPGCSWGMSSLRRRILSGRKPGTRSWRSTTAGWASRLRPGGNGRKGLAWPSVRSN